MADPTDSGVSLNPPYRILYPFGSRVQVTPGRLQPGMPQDRRQGGHIHALVKRTSSKGVVEGVWGGFDTGNSGILRYHALDIPLGKRPARAGEKQPVLCYLRSFVDGGVTSLEPRTFRVRPG